MTEKQFIFSNERKYLLSRHLSFWIAFSLVCFITGAYPYKPRDLLNSEFYSISLIWVVCFLPVSIFFTYLFLKLILPFISLKARLLKIIFALSISSLVNITISCLLTRIALLEFHGTENESTLKESIQLAWFHSIVFTILLTCLITAIIVIKGWYLQAEENTKLYKQKVYNELNVLKSQIYPSFLFNSLITLRNQLDRSSTEAAELLLNLSDILSYILYDSGNELVLLKKEINIIKNFIEVVKHDRINPIITEESITDSYDRYIPPLLLFSLLEFVLSETNKQTGEEPCIHISISEKDYIIEFIIICRFKKLQISDQYKKKEIKEIQDRLKIFPMIDRKLTVIKNENSIHFSIRIETTNCFNFSNNGQELKN